MPTVSSQHQPFNPQTMGLQTEAVPRQTAKKTLTKQSACALIESDVRFHAIFENAAMGIALLTKDGRPIAVNAITEKTIGYNFDKLDHADPRSFAVPEDRALDEHQIHLNWLVTRLAVAFHL